MRQGLRRAWRHFAAATVGFALVLAPTLPLVWAGPPFAEFLDPNPAPGNRFGDTVVALSTGNVVITSPYDDAGGPDAGAVYLFNGATGALISTLLGSSPNDNIGLIRHGIPPGSVTPLANGNYVIKSPFWDNGAVVDAGAVTWGSGVTGVSGVVGPSNSLVGSTGGDEVGTGDVTALTNGNYVVSSWRWDNGAAMSAGAVTWGSGTTGVVGVVSASNSLVGSATGDRVGDSNFDVSSVTALSNGNYVVTSPHWDNGVLTDAGAVTWGNGAVGVSGVVSPANSLVGSKANDQIGIGQRSGGGDGYNGVTRLTNGNYVVVSPYWDNGAVVDAGAVTWGNGTTGVKGVVGPGNSLVGSKANDRVGYPTPGPGLTNSGVVVTSGGYVVASSLWDNGAAVDAGAVTWGSGTSGVSGAVGASNSLVGSTSFDYVGSGSVTTLTNGNYVVTSSDWDGLAANVGAVTWGSGTTGIAGVVGASNSLVGSTADDRVGLGGVTALTNGNYVVGSVSWNMGVAVDAGAATWGSGTTGVTGAVGIGNSLVGTSPGDGVGNATALTNGNYVVSSPAWNGAALDVGAVTWGDGTTGIVGPVSASNSLVGSVAFDCVGLQGVTALTNGNYVVRSEIWDGVATDVGAVTWGNGATGLVGVISASNSLVGSTLNDKVGNFGVTALTNGNYVVASGWWHNGGAADAGAVTWGSGVSGIVGTVSATNSLVGSTAQDTVGWAVVSEGSSGNFLAVSPLWDNGPLANAGALTWGNGMGGTVGVLGPISLVGATANSTLKGVVIDPVNGTYLASFVTDGGGRVRLGLLAGDNAPTLGPVSSSDLGATTATLSGSVVADHGFPVTARGFVYSPTATNGAPTIGGLGVSQVGVAGTTGPMSSPVSGLMAATSYSFRAFATSTAGTSYSAIDVFSTLPSRVFVATTGNDANDCAAQATPCRNLAAAISDVAIDGEVIILTPGEYDTAPILIGKGVKITSPSGTVAFIRQPITVNAPGARVALRGLTLKGSGVSSAITLTAADTLSIEDTTVDGWSVGLDIANAAPSNLAITNSVLQGNQTAVRDLGPGSNRVAIGGSRFAGNATGLLASAGTFVVRESSFAANVTAISVSSGLVEINRTQLWGNGTGLAVLSGGTARIGRSHAFGNTTGLSAAGGSTLASFGSNVIRGNATNIDGTVTTIPEQ